MGLCLRQARSSSSASSQASGKGVAFESAPFYLRLVDGIGGFGGRFEEEGEREAGDIVVVSDAAVVETGDGGAAADREVERCVEAVVLRISGGGGGRGLLFAAAGGGVDGGQVE